MSLAVVHSAAKFKANSGGGKNVGGTLPGAPTAGNLILVLAFIGDSAPNPAAGWNVDATTYSGAADSGYFCIYYRYAQVGDTATVAPDATTRTLSEVVIYEISGVSGTWATDFKGSHCNPALYSNFSGSYSYTTASFNTAANNELVLGLQAQVTGTNNSFVFAATPSPSGTTDQNVDAVGDAGGWFGITLNGNMLGTHQVVGSSGTAVTVGVVGNGGSAITSSYTGYIFAELVGAAASTETGNVTLALSGVSFAAAEDDDKGTAGLALTKVSFAVNETIKETAAVTLGLKGVSFTTHETRKETGTATLALQGVSISVSAVDINALNPVRQFSTFG